MERYALDHPTIAAVGHDGRRLHVEFASGRVYVVRDVTRREVGAFLAAASLLDHFNRYFRRRVQAIEGS